MYHIIKELRYRIIIFKSYSTNCLLQSKPNKYLERDQVHMEICLIKTIVSLKKLKKNQNVI